MANTISTMLNCCLADLLNYPLYRRCYTDHYHHSQSPTTPYGTAASPASFSDFFLVDTWSTWLWRWLAIAALTLPPEIAKGAGYDASITASHRDLSWHPYCSTLHLRPANHHLQKVSICWRSSNHTYWWGWQAVEGALTNNMATLGEYLQTWKLKLTNTKMVSVVFHLNNKEAKREMKVNFNNETPSAPSPNTME